MRRKGFTLIELLVTVMITAIIVPVLYMSVTLVWKSMAAATRSTSSSTERSLLAAYFSPDVAQATSVVMNPASPCAPLKDGAAGTTLVTLPRTGGAVSYVLSGSRPEYDGTSSDLLVRIDCSLVPHRQTVVSTGGNGSIDFNCISGGPGDPCRTVEVTMTRMDGETVLSAIRRVG